MTIPNKWENKNCSRPPTRIGLIHAHWLKVNHRFDSLLNYGILININRKQRVMGNGTCTACIPKPCISWAIRNDNGTKGQSNLTNNEMANHNLGIDTLPARSSPFLTQHGLCSLLIAEMKGRGWSKGLRKGNHGLFIYIKTMRSLDLDGHLMNPMWIFQETTS